MPKINTSELTGAALDWVVAKCEGYESRITPSVKAPYTQILYPLEKHRAAVWACYNPSTNWAQGGLIIERRFICLNGDDGDGSKSNWDASIFDDGEIACCGNTPLIAAMRCYVASTLGETVDIPEGLIE